MNQSMKAAVYKGKQKFEIETFPIPELQPNEVLIKVILRDMRHRRARFSI